MGRFNAASRRTHACNRHIDTAPDQGRTGAWLTRSLKPPLQLLHRRSNYSHHCLPTCAAHSSASNCTRGRRRRRRRRRAWRATLAGTTCTKRRGVAPNLRDQAGGGQGRCLATASRVGHGRRITVTERWTLARLFATCPVMPVRGAPIKSRAVSRVPSVARRASPRPLVGTQSSELSRRPRWLCSVHQQNTLHDVLRLLVLRTARTVVRSTTTCGVRLFGTRTTVLLLASDSTATDTVCPVLYCTVPDVRTPVHFVSIFMQRLRTARTRRRRSVQYNRRSRYNRIGYQPYG